MKTILKLSLLVVVCCTLVTSCDENYKIEDADNPKEGLMSNTGDNKQILSTDGKEVLSEVIHHKSYASGLSTDEINDLWNQDMIDLKVPSLKGANSSEWFQRVITHTGSGKYNDTDDLVHVVIFFETDQGYYRTRARLDNEGDDREKGQWDYYLIRSFIPDKKINWVMITRSALGLKGTDGWFVTSFEIDLSPMHQNIPCYGRTYTYAEPNVWLDNVFPYNWDYFDTGDTGVGRIDF